MYRLDLSEEQRAALLRAVEQQVAELGDEITHTDANDYKRALKRKRSVLNELLNRLRGEEVGA